MGFDIKGLNLQIDDSVQELCKVSNSTSTNTRGVLYFVIVVNVLSLIAVLNTHRYNWITERIEDSRKTLIEHTKSLQAATTTAQKQALADSVSIARMKFDARSKSLVDNYLTVKLPIFGYVFDINDLGIVSGVTLIILLIVLRFTIVRESTNLSLALNAIKERYPPDANPEDFEKYVTQKSSDLKVQEDILSDINMVRRQHHYNFLSMNEIFNFPPVKSLNKAPDLQASVRKSKIGISIFRLPSVTYMVVLVNDLTTFQTGWNVHPVHTVFNFTLTAICWLTITWLCWRCVRQENEISEIYQSFYQSNFGYPARQKQAVIAVDPTSQNNIDIGILKQVKKN